MNEIAIILVNYAKDKSSPGRLIQVIAEKEYQWQAWPFHQAGLSDYAVT